MSQLVYIQPNSLSKLNIDPLKKDWNDFQHLATQSRYLRARPFTGLQPPRYKLSTVKKQIYNPKLPSIRHIERDEVLCRLPDEHCRHTTSLTEEEFQNFDPTRDINYTEFSGLNWHDTGKVLMGSNESLPVKPDTSPAFGARLRAEKSQDGTRQEENQLFRSTSLSTLTPSATITKPMKYNYQNFGNGIFNQSNKDSMWPRVHMNTRNSFDSINRVPMPVQMENIFRSSSMYAGVGSRPWKPIGTISNYSHGSKTTRS